MENPKLNIFQRGLAQKAITFIVYFFLVGLFIYFLDKLDQAFFLKTLELAVPQKIITKETLLKLETLIDSRQSIVGVFPFFIGLGVVALGWQFMRFISKYNLSLPITLPDVVEFRPAMQQLGMNSLAEEIELVRNFKVQIFIAKKPLIMTFAKNIAVQLYPFADHSILSVTSVFEKYIGARRLCITKFDYEHLEEEMQSADFYRNDGALIEKNKAIQENATTITLLQKELIELQKSNTLLKAENAKFSNAQKPQKAQETNRVKRLRKERLQWIIINETIDKIFREATEGQTYTEKEIKDMLEEAWQDRGDLQIQMEKLVENRALDISESMMNCLKDYLAEVKFYSRSGGRPTKKSKISELDT